MVTLKKSKDPFKLQKVSNRYNEPYYDNVIEKLKSTSFEEV